MDCEGHRLSEDYRTPTPEVEARTRRPVLPRHRAMRRRGYRHFSDSAGAGHAGSYAYRTVNTAVDGRLISRVAGTAGERARRAHWCAWVRADAALRDGHAPFSGRWPCPPARPGAAGRNDRSAVPSRHADRAEAVVADIRRRRSARLRSWATALAGWSIATCGGWRLRARTSPRKASRPGAALTPRPNGGGAVDSQPWPECEPAASMPLSRDGEHLCAADLLSSFHAHLRSAARGRALQRPWCRACGEVVEVSVGSDCRTRIDTG